MADLKISQLNAITVLTPATDVLPVVDSGGVTKKITTNQILGSGGTATLASATITGDLTVDTSTLKVDSTNNRVGIGTASPSNNLHVKGASGDTLIRIEAITDGLLGFIGSASGVISGSPANNLAIRAENGLYLSGNGNSTQFILNSAGNVTVSNGNVILGTSGKGIDFSATASGSGTMTSELLNDYEEGTFTPSITFGGGSTGITYSQQTLRYTKVGRVVSVQGLIALLNKGSSTGQAVITGLPFTIANSISAYSAVSIWLSAVTPAAGGSANQAYGVINTAVINLSTYKTDGSYSNLTDANFANNSELILNLTYTV